MTFTEDLKFGQIYEEKAKEYFIYDSVVSAPNKRFSEWDFKFFKDGIPTKVEVKSDTYACNTNNMCIEFKYNGCKSGISTTRSDYYMYFVIKRDGEEDVYQIPTNYIRKLILKNDFRTVKGGDNYKSEMYLIPIKNFSDYQIYLYECGI